LAVELIYYYLVLLPEKFTTCTGGINLPAATTKIAPSGMVACGWGRGSGAKALQLLMRFCSLHTFRLAVRNQRYAHTHTRPP